MAARDALQAQLEQGIDQLGLQLPPDAVSQLLDYQALLEERWITKLKKRYPVKVKGKVFKQLLE